MDSRKFFPGEYRRQLPALTGIEAAMFVLSPFFLVAGFTETDGILPLVVQHFFGISAPFITFLSVLFWNKHRNLSSAFILYTLVGTALTSIHYLTTHPSATLIFNCLLICFITYRITPSKQTAHNLKYPVTDVLRLRICWAAVAGIGSEVLIPLVVSGTLPVARYLRPLIFILFLMVMTHHAISVKRVAALSIYAVLGSGLWFLPHNSVIPDPAMLYGILYATALTLFLRHDKWYQRIADRWSIFVNQPARILIFSFILLAASGTIFLKLPFITPAGMDIRLIDAAFTSVSAVCVTGLTVLDTSRDFTCIGQSVILLLIQLGGLGIMSITAVAMHVTGHRISLRQERILSEITADNGHTDLLKSIATIFRFTMIMEGCGALVLAFLFFLQDDTFIQAVWRGIFTAVSAFCNAGFALQNDSLIAYRSSPAILNTIAFLIIAGGMAPVTFLSIPYVFRRRGIPVAAVIPLTTTAVLLVSGTILFLVLEWQGMLDGLSIFDKVDNAWFQSVTLRTAGFNSIDISHSAGSTLLVMLLFMFIGGSPGGTAGGVKTAVIGVLALTFWGTVISSKEMLIRNRRIVTETIMRSVTIVISGCIVWFCTVIMLMATQQIGARDLVFEAMSALGTVGLSIGATTRLDELGKIIIMIAMFAGRVGPMTLFMILGNQKMHGGMNSPEATIPLT